MLGARRIQCWYLLCTGWWPIDCCTMSGKS